MSLEILKRKARSLWAASRGLWLDGDGGAWSGNVPAKRLLMFAAVKVDVSRREICSGRFHIDIVSDIRPE
jgi:hypothetical protein